MDAFMESYFKEVFESLDRDCLNERFKRRELVQYFSTVISGCAKGENESDNGSCRNFVRVVLRYHNKCKSKNGNVCLMGKYHNILYIAMKLTFDWSLQDNGTVAALLDEIYACEGTFERIFLGAIFGTSAPHFLAGWKSDFLDREENVHALVFFLDHATNANLEYAVKEKIYRFIDVPLESCGTASPIRVIMQMGSSEMLMILLRFGGKINAESSSNPVETILDRLMEYKGKYPYELVGCLRLVMRTVPALCLSIDKEEFKDLNLPMDYNYQRKVIIEKYGDLLTDHLIPSTRCGLKPAELKHLCRCKIRNALWNNFQLPFGIRALPIPESLKKYIDLFDD